MLNKKKLRSQLRIQRRSLGKDAQIRAAKAIAARIALSLPYQRAKTIAFYAASDGEITLSFLLKLANKHRKQCYFPAINNKDAMEFRLLSPHNKLSVKNKFGIAEPTPQASAIEAKQLDLVLVPLVGFDSSGNRLGMGGGYYDKTFEFRNEILGKPVLMGVAHSCQKVERLVPEAWDIALDYVITDEEQLKFKGQSSIGAPR